MSEFSEFCRILQEKSGMTIYQMAESDGNRQKDSQTGGRRCLL